jgi:CheY-like chemotaxis protein
MSDDLTSSFRDQLAQVRHDLKTPVGHIIGYGEMLEEEFEDDPWPEFETDLKQILTSGHRLVELIEDLLGASKTSIDDIDIPGTQYQLRQQLNHITGYCEMLRELAEDEDRDEVLPDLDRITQASVNFTGIVDKKVRTSVLDVETAAAEAADSKGDAGDLDQPGIGESESLQVNWLGEGGDILVVDDNPVNCDLLTRRLERQGYHAIAVESGEGALQLLEVEKFDLILLDLLMPGMSGIEVLEHLKQDPVLRNIPVIVLSALDDMEKIVRCVLLGADDYLFKPFNPVLLKARIAASLEKARLRRQNVPKLKVFISSPGDVIPERRIVRVLINQLNEEFAEQVFLTPIFWEDEPLLASDTFQAQIYPAHDADIYIGIFWSRLGSPLPDHIRRPDGSRYLSGSEYEFEDAMSGFQKKGRPEILVYRKTAEPVVGLNDRDLIMDRLQQKERLEEFVRKWFMTEDGESYIGAFHAFGTEENFELMISTHLRKLVVNQLKNFN